MLFKRKSKSRKVNHRANVKQKKYLQSALSKVIKPGKILRILFFTIKVTSPFFYINTRQVFRKQYSAATQR